jgi:hypothetical protein
MGQQAKLIDLSYGTTCLIIVRLAMTTRKIYSAEAEAEKLKS